MVSKKSKPLRKVNRHTTEHKAAHETKEPKHHKASHEASEHKAAHEARHAAKPRQASDSGGIWMVLTIVLGVLLILSVMNHGFRPATVDSVQGSLNKLLTQDFSQDVKQSLQEAVSSLDTAKELLSQQTTKPDSNYDGKTVKLDFYVMSQCPYGTQVEDAVKPALDKLGNAVDFSVNFIATDNGDGTFRSLHGDNEVQGDLVEECAMKYNPDKYMDMVVCMNQNAAGIPGNWEKCAKDNGLDVNKIKTCYEGTEAKTLLSQSIKASEAVNAQGSPTMYINGNLYNGARDSLSFLRALCAGLDNHPECATLPACGTDSDCNAESGKIGTCVNANQDDAHCEYTEPKPVNLIVISDKDCPDCAQYASLASQLQSIFKGLKVTQYDFSDAQGQKLYDELNLTALPAYLFDETVKQGEGFTQVQNYLEPHGDYYSLRVGASYNPNAEICNNGIDDRDQDGLVDCADPECSGEWECMQKLDVPKVDLFVMSYCPYGTQTEKGILPVVNLLGDKIDFNVRFVYYAMHGQKEVDENTVQYCIQSEQNDKYIDYLSCFLEAGDEQGCLTKTGVDTDMLDTCVANTDSEFDITKNYNDKASWLSGAYPLYDVDKELNTQYDVGGSPTLVINGVVANAARDPQSLLDAVCLGFKDKPAECDTNLSTSAYGPGFGFDAQTDSGSAAAAASCG